MALPKYLKNLDSLIAAIAGFYAVHLYTAYSGIGISPDSIMYASTARNIYEHGSLLTFNGSPLVFFPVFYPFFLSIALFISRVDTVTAAPYINGLLFATVIFTAGYIVSKFKSNSLIYKWLILIALVLSPALLEIYTYLWSETLFILETVLFVLVYRNYMLKHSMKSLLLLSLLVAVSCITRYAGVTLIGAGGLLMLLDDELVIRKKIQHVLIFGFSSISLLVLNLIKNRLSTGLSTGTREPAVTPLSRNLYYAGTVMCDWMGLPNKFYPYAIAIACIILLSLVALLAWRAYNKKMNTTENIVIMFAAFYGIFIPVLASVSRFEPLNSRLLSPMFVCLLIACTSWVPDILSGLQLKKQLVYAIPFVVLMLAFEYSVGATDYQRYDDEGDYGVPGYTDDDWNTSKFITFLKTHKDIYKPGVPKYSDADEAVYFFTGTTATLLPHRYFTNTVAHFYGVKHYYLIWFKNLNNTELIGLKDIQQQHKLTTLYSFPEGAVYEYNADGK
ncbi:hypothetical protein HDF18_01855 [Mucilaginibacter sp. X5P1]|uniref:hypothetical protein n=1 Tax=Mucilaginibacter sp. X5P1 TaxID=2723088 RepID=UPI00160A2D3E|nr:hypothetical protein [Mucilaginibacter sp. X5P1]MBB6138146.1 hypothetical protein [Mucilaginibacter sp. X5P1]